MQKRNASSQEQLIPKCRKTSFFLRVHRSSIKLASKYFTYLAKRGRKYCYCKLMAGSANITRPGHFAVVTSGKGEQKKFHVKLNYLSYPPFLRLLEAAEREFGFEQQGVLAIPCEASELENIIASLKTPQEDSSTSNCLCMM